MKKIVIVKDAIALYQAVGFAKARREWERAASNMYHNPQENFDRGVAAMLYAYKEMGPCDYIALIGECSLPDVVLSSQNPFTEEIQEKFNTAGIEVTLQIIAATSDKFWTDEIIAPIEKDAGVGLREIEFESCEIGGEFLRRTHFDIFNYDKNVVVYKIIPKS